MSPIIKTAYLTTRVTIKMHLKFRNKAVKRGALPATVLRELIEAFVEDRLIIQPRQTM